MSDKEYRTGKPYTCDDVYLVLERKGSDIEVYGVYELLMMMQHLQTCLNDCEGAISKVIDLKVVIKELNALGDDDMPHGE